MNRQEEKRNESPNALSGIRVVEFAVFAAGPIVGKQLAEHGAEVIRVESAKRPDGFRVHYPPFKDKRPGLNRGGSFAIFNNDVLSVTIELKDNRGQELAKRLVSRSDIVIENFAPGVVERLGLSYQSLCEVNPGIIMLSSCNQGQTGPRSRQKGFGSQLTCLSGFSHLTGYGPEEPPVLLYGPYIDFIGGGFGLIAVLAALDYRRRTGTGQYIDLSQYECGLQFITPLLLDFQLNGRTRGPRGNRDSMAAPHGAFRCKGDDRWCVLSVSTEDEWKALCLAAEHPEWSADPRFKNSESRREYEEELEAILNGWTCRFSAEEVMEKLQAVGVPSGVVQSVADLFSCPQLAHRNQWRPLEHPEMGRYEYEAPPFVLSETPAQLNRPSPCLGEHNDYVLGEILGLSEGEIGELQDSGIVA